LSKDETRTDHIAVSGEGPGEVKSKVREYAEAIILALILALFIRTFVIQAFKIPSPSMVPTLLVGDHILVNKFLYGIKLPFVEGKILAIRDPRPGDVIVFRYPRDRKLDFIKRCIAVGGDKVEIIDGRVWVNGEIYEFSSLPDHREDFSYYFKQDLGQLPCDLRERRGITHKDYIETIGEKEHLVRYHPGAEALRFMSEITVPEGKIFVMGDNRDNSNDSRYWGFVDLNDVKGEALVIYWSWNQGKTWPRFSRIGEGID
jgi:signal peptidase I